MPPIRLPNTGKIIFVNEHIGDINIDYADHPDVDDTIKNEDVKVIGDWVDYTGSKVQTAVNYQGVQDIDPSTLKGQIEDPELNLTNRGRLASTRRQRSRIINIQLDGNKNNCK